MKRNTSQRKAIEEVFNYHDRPLSLDDILRYGRESVETLNQATVYRNLKILLENGWLTKIHHPTCGTMYERAGKGHHHHFFCRKCDSAYDLPGCGVKTENAAPKGFVVEGHEMFLTGICAECRNEEESP